MKTRQLIVTTILCALLIGCSGGAVNDQLIINGVSVATSTGLSQVKDPVLRHTIANLLQGYAPGLRTLTNNPTPEQLAALIDQYTPQEIKDRYPAAVAFATPLVINAVETAIANYGKDNATVIKVVNDVATGLELGSAGQTTPHVAHVFGRTMRLRPCPPFCVTWDGRLAVTRRSGD